MKDSEPAFPVLWPLPNAAAPGMSLRDYFAAKAVNVWIGGYGNVLMDENADFITEHLPKVARFAYAVADAMLAAREAKS